MPMTQCELHGSRQRWIAQWASKLEIPPRIRMMDAQTLVEDGSPPAEILVKEGFTFFFLLPYINADPVLAKAIAGRWHCDGDAARFANRGVIVE